MISVSFPNDNVPERAYAIRAVFTEILGCPEGELHLSSHDSADYYRIQGFGKTILVEDHFFRDYSEPLSYLKKESLPVELSYFHMNGDSVPVLYGRDYCSFSGDTMAVGLDVFASAFFMLSRWEEYVYGREEEGDCDETLLFCVKNGIERRPLVHEYAMLLYRLLGAPEVLKPVRKFSVVLTHDVDALMTPAWSPILRTLLRNRPVGGLVYNKSMSFGDVLRYKFRFPTIFGQTKDYLGLAKQYGIAEWFYVKVCSPGERGYTYNYQSETVRQYFSWLCEEVGSQNVGFHPSQLTFNNQDQWNRETDRIREVIPGNPQIGRNHHLLYNSQTLRNWALLSGDAAKPVLVSNSVFHKRLGFRSGTTVPYTIFDIFERKPLLAKECPCAIMDTAMNCGDNYNLLEDGIQRILDTIRLYDGQVVLTWHILIREINKYDFLFRLCKDTIAYAMEKS